MRTVCRTTRPGSVLPVLGVCLIGLFAFVALAVDLGMLGLYWHIRDIRGGDSVAPSAVDTAAGYPEFDELVDAYSARLGAGVPELGWYRAFAAYKLAVILEGIHFRYLGGDTVGDGFDRIGALVAPLADEGLAQLAGVVR